MRITIISLFFAALFTQSASGADLSTIPKRLIEEPRYQSKLPKYCLLTFGAKAQKRVWLVLDGDTLYVDRNGDGRLKGNEEKVPKDVSKKSPLNESIYPIGEISVGKQVHQEIMLVTRPLSVFPKEVMEDAPAFIKQLYQENPNGHIYQIGANIALPGFQGTKKDGRVFHLAGVDSKGALQFANSAAKAPIIHFGGALQTQLLESVPFSLQETKDVNVVVGTPGVGRGTLAMVEYEKFLPKEAHPVLAISWPAKTAGAEPIKKNYKLPERC